MPYYKGLFDAFIEVKDKAGGRRAGQRLLSLRRQLSKELPQRTVADTLLLATWNVREFGSGGKFGPRTYESLQFIAEIISRFDLVAVQEVTDNLSDLKKVMSLLGRWWDYLVTDVTEGRSGNRERIAFVYDSRKVRFAHLAGEVVLAEEKGKPSLQLARSPFLCAFSAGWRTFSLCSVHIYYGTSVPDEPRRVREIDKLAGVLARRNQLRQETPDGEPDMVVLLGDFNIFNQKGDKTLGALEKHEFFVPESITKIPKGSNIARDKYYDQIAVHDPSHRLRPTANAGVFDFTQSIYREQDCDAYVGAMRSTDPKKFPAVARSAEKRLKYFRQWRTFQVSDHLPLWIELQIDFSDGYIATRAGFHDRKR